MCCNSHIRLKIYLAGPLFSEAEQAFNAMLTEKLEEFAEVYLPQRDGGLMSEFVKNGTTINIAAKHIFQQDIHAIKKSDIIVAILDGRAIDEGVAVELGYGYCLGKKCIGLQTDSRRLASWGNNPMITGVLDATFFSIQELISNINSKIGVSADDHSYSDHLSN